jgi:malate dehydrogenase (oxaloacetate-decarboxylating)
MGDYFSRSIIVHEQLRGKIGIHNKIPINNRADLSIAYTPGVARPCEEIANNPARARDLTIKRNSVAVVSDGSAEARYRYSAAGRVDQCRAMHRPPGF